MRTEALLERHSVQQRSRWHIEITATYGANEPFVNDAMQARDTAHGPLAMLNM
ncbi:MAG: hypothetical protein M3Y05_13935 [Gemmatimonadota bacterium]|nr:hypothetical protein [Gemmatimonadota bacterium]